MLSNIGIPTLILIIIIALLLFGPNKLPELGRAFGRTLREFKKGAREIMEDDEPSDGGKKAAETPEASDSFKADRTEGPQDDKRLPE